MSKNRHNKKVGSSIERTDERIKETQEVFTPIELCQSMVNDIPEHILENPNSKFLDNSAGNGNFIATLIDKLSKYHDRQHVVDHMVYAVEMMEDNHKELCDRIDVSVDHPHYVCHDALTYDYSFGEAVGLETELGKLKKPKPFVQAPLKKEPSEARLPF